MWKNKDILPKTRVSTSVWPSFRWSPFVRFFVHNTFLFPSVGRIFLVFSSKSLHQSHLFCKKSKGIRLLHSKRPNKRVQNRGMCGKIQAPGLAAEVSSAKRWVILGRLLKNPNKTDIYILKRVCNSILHNKIICKFLDIFISQTVQ
jgi:hypothetical protein